MQDDRLWLYGESYGTQLSQTYAAAHPDRLGGLVLDGTVDLTLDGPTFLTQQAKAFSDTLTGTLQGCDVEAGCGSDLGGDAVALYDQLAAALARAPIPFDFPLADGGTARRAFTLADLEAVAAGQVYTEGDRMLLERALAGAARGDLVPLARLLYPNLGLDPQTEQVIPDPSYSDAIYYAVECQDYAYYAGEPGHRADQYLRAGRRRRGLDPPAGVDLLRRPPVHLLAGLRHRSEPPCSPAGRRGCPRSVLGATADPATPYGNGVAVFSRLADGYLVTQQDGPHVIFGRGNACPDDLVTAFLVDGRRPDERRTICPARSPTTTCRSRRPT